jgi:hypothetical protein
MWQLYNLYKTRTIPLEGAMLAKFDRPFLAYSSTFRLCLSVCLSAATEIIIHVIQGKKNLTNCKNSHYE